MNKEQMLETLKNIKTKIEQDNLDNYNLDNRVEELEKIKKDREKIDGRISFLSDKIINENNYRNNYSALNDEALRYDLDKTVANNNIAVEVNKNYINELNEDIAKANESISSAKLEIDSLNEELLINGQLLRSLGENPDKEELEIINDELSKVRNRVNYLDSNISRLQETIKNKNMTLKYENIKTNQLKKDLDNAKAALIQFDSNVVNTPYIDEAKRRADTNELDTLKYEKSELLKKERMLSLDYSLEFDRVYNDLLNDVITVDDASKNIESIVNTIPEGYFIESIDVRDKELILNRQMQTEVQDRMERLNKKLNDDSQYSVSAFVAERNNSLLKSWETKLSQYGIDKENIVKKGIVLNSDLNVYETLLQECEKSLAEKGEEFRGFGNNISNEDNLRIQASLRTLRQEKQEIQDDINTVRSEIVNNTNESLKIENKYDKTQSVIKNLKDSLNDRNTIDRSKKRLDETKLAACVSSLRALKNREKFIKESFADVVSKAIGVSELKEDKKPTTINVEYNDNVIEKINNNLQSKKIPAKLEIRNDINRKYASIEAPKKKIDEKQEIPNFPKELEVPSIDEKATKIEIQHNDDVVNNINNDLKEAGIPAVLNSEDTAFEDYVEEFDKKDANNNKNIEEEITKETKETNKSKKWFGFKFKKPKMNLLKKVKSSLTKEKIYKFIKRAAVTLTVVLSLGLTGSEMYEKLNEPTGIEKIVDTDDRNKILLDNDLLNPTDSKTEKKPELEETPEVEVNPEIETTPEVEDNFYKKPLQHTTNYGTSNNDHDNSDKITVPEITTPEIETTPEVEETPFIAPDAVIENVEPEVEEPTIETTPDVNLNEEVDSDITITPEVEETPDVTVTPEVEETPKDKNEDIVIEDAPTEDLDIKEESTFDNLDDLETTTPEVEVNPEDKNEDIVIEDAPTEDLDVKEENTFDNLDNLETTTPEVETTPDTSENPDIVIEDAPTEDLDIKEENTFDNLNSSNNVETPDVVQDPNESNVNIMVNDNESFTTETNAGQTYTYDNSNNNYNNINTNSKDMTENNDVSSIEYGENGNDTVVFDAESLERNEEFTKEQLKELREEFANFSGNDIVTDENVKLGF